MVDQATIDQQADYEALKAQVQELTDWKARVMRNGLKDLYGRAGQMRFGGNLMRLDTTGMQIRTDTTILQALYWLNQFSLTPGSVLPRAQLLGLGAATAATGAQAKLQATAASTTGASVLVSDATGTTLITMSAANTGGAAQIQVFSDTGANGYVAITGPLAIAAVGSDYAVLTDGEAWYRTDTDKFRGRANGTTDNFAMEAWVTANALAATRGNWKVFYSDGSGVFTELALGASGTVLTSGGASAAPSWASAGGGMYATNPINTSTSAFATLGSLVGLSTPATLMWTQINSAVLQSGTNIAESTLGTWTPHFDSTLNRWYIDNTTGAVNRKHFALSGGTTITPTGPLHGALAAFDADSGAITGLPPSGLDCFVYEFRFLVATARASDTTRFVGYSNDMTTGLGAAQFGIGMYRKSGGSGWTLKTTDGTTSSDASESSDTSDGNVHIGRIEWHAKATPEARLYIDGTLKVTKTTNLPALSSTTKIQQIGFSVATGDATNDFRFYDGLFYWKNAV